MKRLILVLVISGLFAFYLSAQSFVRSFQKALDDRNIPKMEEILKAWDQADANDPELYIAYLNFYTVRSRAANVLSITGYDQKYSKMALDYISEGIKRFPMRFDFRVVKIYMLGELRNYKEYVAEVMDMIRYSAKIENNWKREEFMLLDKSEVMFYDAVLEAQSFLFSKGDPALLKEIIRISEEMLKYYPGHIQSFISMSRVYREQKEENKALEILLQAIRIDPINTILVYNIANMYKIKGDYPNSMKYYELAVKYARSDEENIKEAALRNLAELK